MAAGIPFALFPSSPTPYELKHLVKVSKVKKIFTSPQNLENARVVFKEAGFSESDVIFILEGRVKGKRSFDDLVRSVKEPAKDYAKSVNNDALAYLTFSSGTTGPPKGELSLQTIYISSLSCSSYWVARCHDVTQEYHVLSDAGVHRGGIERSGCTGQFLPEPDLTTFALTSVMKSPLSPHDQLIFRLRWYPCRFTTVMGWSCSVSVRSRFRALSSSYPNGM